MIFELVQKYFKCYKNYTLENAIDKIFEDFSVYKGKVTILFAPACSSFDQFKSLVE